MNKIIQGIEVRSELLSVIRGNQAIENKLLVCNSCHSKMEFNFVFEARREVVSASTPCFLCEVAFTSISPRNMFRVSPSVPPKSSLQEVASDVAKAIAKHDSDTFIINSINELRKNGRKITIMPEILDTFTQKKRNEIIISDVVYKTFYGETLEQALRCAMGSKDLQ